MLCKCYIITTALLIVNLVRDAKIILCYRFLLSDCQKAFCNATQVHNLFHCSDTSARYQYIYVFVMQQYFMFYPVVFGAQH